MSRNAGQIRCSGCGRLLAKVIDGRLEIQRGDLQAIFAGTFRASIVCSQRRCRRTNFVSVLSQPTSEGRFS